MDQFKNKKINNRRYPGIKGIRPDNKEHKRAEAKERLAAWDKLSPQDKMNLLDARLGKDIGAAKQRARILAGMAQKGAEKGGA